MVSPRSSRRLALMFVDLVARRSRSTTTQSRATASTPFLMVLRMIASRVCRSSSGTGRRRIGGQPSSTVRPRTTCKNSTRMSLTSQTAAKLTICTLRRALKNGAEIQGVDFTSDSKIRQKLGHIFSFPQKAPKELWAT